MKIALYGKPFEGDKAKYIQHLIHKLEINNVSIIIEQQFHDRIIDDIGQNTGCHQGGTHNVIGQAH